MVVDSVSASGGDVESVSALVAEFGSGSVSADRVVGLSGGVTLEFDPVSCVILTSASATVWESADDLVGLLVGSAPATAVAVFDEGAGRVPPESVGSLVDGWDGTVLGGAADRARVAVGLDTGDDNDLGAEV